MCDPRTSTLLLSAYACCPDRGSEPRYGWNYLLLHARTFRRVILVTSATDSDRVTAALEDGKIRNVSVVVVRMPFRLDKLHDIPVGGIHLHYWLWLRAALKRIRHIEETIDFAHHITYGSLQFGSPLYELRCPFIFGPVGGGQVTNKVFYPLMGKARYTENIRNLVSTLFYRFNPHFKETMARASLIYCSNIETWTATRGHLPAGERNKAQLLLDTVLDERFLSTPPRQRKRTGQGISALWVGRLIPRKGIEILLNTALLLKDEAFTLTMVGDGPLREKTLRFIKDHGLEDTIQFVGQKGQEQLLQYYRGADVLLFLSYRDSTGLQIMEAFSQGVPVIALDQFGASILITDETGIKIPVVGTLDEMQQNVAGAIRDLIREPERVASMGENAIRYAREFTWETRNQKILQDIKSLLLHEDADLRLERV
ncbi:MAG TPA: glycosyltransferase family 4 protein [Puia sp.]|nr:glycosyltransferase family 4 protein [Puia sp.]